MIICSIVTENINSFSIVLTATGSFPLLAIHERVFAAYQATPAGSRPPRPSVPRTGLSSDPRPGSGSELA